MVVTRLVDDHFKGAAGSVAPSDPSPKVLLLLLLNLIDLMLSRILIIPSSPWMRLPGVTWAVNQETWSWTSVLMM